MALELHASNKNSVESISRQLGIAKRTLYRYLERHKAVLVTDLPPVEHAFAEMPKN